MLPIESYYQSRQLLQLIELKPTKQINKLIDFYNYRINKIASSSSLNNDAFERGYDAGYIQAMTLAMNDLIELKDFVREFDKLSIITENDDDDI